MCNGKILINRFEPCVTFDWQYGFSEDLRVKYRNKNVTVVYSVFPCRRTTTWTSTRVRKRDSRTRQLFWNGGGTLPAADLRSNINVNWNRFECMAGVGDVVAAVAAATAATAASSAGRSPRSGQGSMFAPAEFEPPTNSLCVLWARSKDYVHQPPGAIFLGLWECERCTDSTEISFPAATFPSWTRQTADRRRIRNHPIAPSSWKKHVSARDIFLSANRCTHRVFRYHTVLSGRVFFVFIILSDLKVNR